MKIAVILGIFFLNLFAAQPTVRQMAAQMITVGFNGNDVKSASAAISDAKYKRFGGVMLLAKNISGKDGLIRLTSAFKQADERLFIAIDEEGGLVTRFKDKSGFKIFGSALDVAKKFTLSDAKNYYKSMANQLKSVGINLNFAPVVDVSDVSSPIIAASGRAFSGDVNEVSLYANEFLDAFNEVGVLSTLKHFPGHGSAKTDSHLDKTVIENFNYSELKPYFDAISMNKAKLIMVGHVYILGEDAAMPASLSKKIIQGWLRDKLKFGGVVISDDMLMGGLKGINLQKKVLSFIDAGGDIMLFSDFFIGNRKTAEYVTQIIVDGVNQGKIKPERIKQSYDRIMKLKSELE